MLDVPPAALFCRKRETLTGDATLRYYDHLQAFGEHEGLLPNLFTEISTSKERSFTCVDFVDTPGLVDGDMKVTDRMQYCTTHVLQQTLATFALKLLDALRAIMQGNHGCLDR